MTLISNTPKKVDWQEKSMQLLRAACTPWGIKASLTDLDNYNAIFSRDAVMTGIVGVLLKDEVLMEGLKNSLLNFKTLQGEQGQIASNFTVKDGKIDHVSFGTLSPKIDSCTWYLIGIGLLVKEGRADKDIFHESVEKTIALLDGIEYNGKHLIYIPKGGNWADEYVYEGYVLYDQLLRAWAMALLGGCYDRPEWSEKAAHILAAVEANYQEAEAPYLYSSFSPGGKFKRFDLAAHALAGIVFGKDHPFIEKSFAWMVNKFVQDQQFVPAFYPVIKEMDPEWEPLRNYHLFAFKNKPHHYHNGGIWWIWLGWLSVALSIQKKDEALEQLIANAFNYLDQADHFDFEEYLSADELIPNGTKKLCYTATGIVFLSLAKQSFDFSVLQPGPASLIKEPLQLKDQYFQLSDALVQKIQATPLLQKEKLVISVCGESGSGKSITAKCLQIELGKLNIPSVIIHQDSYYKLPPKDNHEKRLADISWVGANEVQLDLMQAHIAQFRANAISLDVPVVDYENNSFSQARTSIKDIPVLIVEGVYAFLLEDLDFKIFMERTFYETLEKRKERSREVYSPFVEEVLAIEHSIVKPLKALADVLVGVDYQVR